MVVDGMCSKGCLRRGRILRDGRVAFTKSGLHGFRQRAEAMPVQGFSEIREAYAEMTRLVPGLGVAPALEICDALGGVGGIFDAEGWFIAIGVRDQEEIAMDLRQRHPHEARAFAKWVCGHPFVSERDVERATLISAMGRCAAHELGHALVFRGWQNPFAPDVEGGADYYAGRLDAARRRDPRIAELFFHTIGCTGPRCTHPEPGERLMAYRTGYQDQLMAAA